MKTRYLFLILLVGLALGVLVIPALARPQAVPNADTYDLTWFTHDGGGGTVISTDGVYSLSATAGQPDAAQLTGGYTLSGGFWYGASLNYGVYLPRVLK